MKHRWSLFLGLVLSWSSVLGAGVTLTWTAPGDDGHAGRATLYDLRYSLTRITVANWNSAAQVMDEPWPQQAGARQSAWVGGLVLGRTYYFCMRTGDEKQNWSPLSNVVAKIAGLGCVGTVGNADCDPSDQVTMGDLTVIIDHLFVSGQPLGCPPEANIDGDLAGEITMSDLTCLIGYLFLDAEELPPCQSQ